MSELVKSLYNKLQEASEPELRINLLNRLAFELMNSDDNRFHRHAEEALTLAEASGYVKGRVDALLNMGRYYFRVAEYDHSINSSTNAYQIAEKEGDNYLRALALDNLSPAYLMGDKPQKALEAALEAIKLFGDIDDPKRGKAMSYNNAGNACTLMGDHQQALQYYQNARVLLQNSGLTSQQLSIEGNIATTLMQLNHPAKAYEKLAALYESFLAIPHYSGAVSALNFMAQCQVQLNNYPRAIHRYTEALKLLNRHPDKGVKVEILLGLGHVFLHIKGYREAREQFNKALALSQQIHFNKGRCSALIHLTECELLAGNHKEAKTLYERALQLVREYNYSGDAKRLEDIGNKL